MPKSRFPLAITLALALLAGACGDSSESSDPNDTSADDPPAVSPEEDAGSAAGEGNDDDDSGGDSTDPEDADPTDEPATLTATDVGVSETTITIGAVFPDLEVIGRDSGDVQAKFQLAVDAVNEAGGINGRMIELVYGDYQPIGDAEADALCVEMVEDNQVFAVVGVLLRDSALCYAERGHTIAINGFPTTREVVERATAPLLIVDPLAGRLVEENIQALADAGHLPPGLKVAVHGNSQSESLHDAYVAALEARDVEVVSQTLRTVNNDIVAAQAEVAVMAERWTADGAEAVLGSAPESATDFVGAYGGAGLDVPMLLPEGSSNAPSLLQDTFGYDLTPLELAVVIIRDTDASLLYANNEAGVADCVDRFTSATGEEVEIDAADGGGDRLGPTIAACQVIDIFSAVATAAGPELTTESFAAAAKNIGAFEVTGLLAASLSEGKPDVSDNPPQVGRFDPDANIFVAGT